MAYGKRDKDPGNGAYEKLRADLKAGTPDRLYLFRGEERYLLEDAVNTLRAMIPEETRQFNHRRLDGRALDLDDLREAVDALPVFAGRTLTEVWDYDFGKMGEDTRRELLRILADIPGTATVVFVFDTVEYKLDGRVKANGELKKLFTEVEFTVRSDYELTRWLAKHFAAGGKKLERDAAARLIAMTGGYMTAMKNEVEKLTSYVSGDTVTAGDVEAVVTPTPEAEVWDLTDALFARKNDLAMEKLSELFRMDVPPHKILYHISQRLRLLLTAKICVSNHVDTQEFMKLADLRFSFQARTLYDTARRTSLTRCRGMAEMAADTAWRLNSTIGDDRALLIELTARLLL